MGFSVSDTSALAHSEKDLRGWTLDILIISTDALLANELQEACGSQGHKTYNKM